MKTRSFTVGRFGPRLRGLRWLLLLALFFRAGTVFAADVQAQFDAANKLYAEGKFAAAAAAYEKIVRSGAVSAALYFNDGDAELKAGHLGRAIAAYRRAALLAPRDAETRANLAFARSQVEGPTLRESHWENWLGQLTLNEWTTLTMVAFWLTFALLVLGQIRPALKPSLRAGARGAAVVTIFLGACLGWEAARQLSIKTAVVVAPKAVARSGPFDEAQQAFAVHDGAELVVRDERNGWLQVGDGATHIGWLPRDQVEVIAGG
ncbi:MAG: hypothetical protein KGJ60_05260 [Verrucomicrobiota bacterium]|nr:hypothetical protein [Verrucomicrobiota bacterium]